MSLQLLNNAYTATQGTYLQPATQPHSWCVVTKKNILEPLAIKARKFPINERSKQANESAAMLIKRNRAPQGEATTEKGSESSAYGRYPA
jgi:hypothetical protein